MAKPRIFLARPGKQAKLLQAPTRGLENIADVEPWTATSATPWLTTRSIFDGGRRLGHCCVEQ